MDKKNASRLGKILLDKGMLTQAELDVAIAEQIKRRENQDPSDPLYIESMALGEILIDLGFINRLQLKRCLNWQMILRNMTIAMSLCAPLMTLGSGVATAATSSSARSSYSTPLTIQAEDYASMSGIQTEATTDAGGGLNLCYIHVNDWMSYNNKVIYIPATGDYKITYRVASPSGGGSFSLHEADGSVHYDTVAVPATGGSQQWVDLVRTISLNAGNHAFNITALTRGSGYNINWFKIEKISSTSSVSNSSSLASSSKSSNASSQSSSSSSSASVPPTANASSSASVSITGPVYLLWNAPGLRENGDYLDITDVGGYELRYRRITEPDYTYITINDAWTTRYYFRPPSGVYEFQVAAFDKNGLYSQFVNISPR